jgi:integrase
MKATYSLVFNRKKKVNKQNKALIEIRIYLNTKNKYISSRQFILIDEWDNKKSRVNWRNKNHTNINLHLEQTLHELEAFELSLITKGKEFSFNDLDNFLAGSRTDSFIEFARTELKQDKTLKKSSLSTELRSITILEQYSNTITFNDITFNFIQGFDRYLHTLEFKTNTRDKVHTHIKKILNLAIKKDLFNFSQNPYKQFKSKTEKTERTVLTIREVEAIEKLIFKPDKIHLERIKDIFLFSCYTGLRSSDLIELTNENFTVNSSGIILKFKSVKTSKVLEIPLHALFKNKKDSISKPELIVKKYIDTPGKLFKSLTNQHINRELKEIAELAKIKKDVTCHVGRHTFGTIMAPKVNPIILKELMQHSKMETTMIYTHISNSVINDELGKINW